MNAYTQKYRQPLDNNLSSPSLPPSFLSRAHTWLSSIKEVRMVAALA